MTPKQLIKVLEKLRIQAEKAKLKAKKKKARILNTAKIILFDLILDIVVHENAPVIDQLGTLVKVIGSDETNLEKVATRQYETKRGEHLMEQILVKNVSLSTSTEEVKSILKEVGQVLVRFSNFPNFIKDLEVKRVKTQKEIQDLLGSFDPLTSSVANFNEKVK